MDRYTARINLRGTTQRERMKNRLIANLNNKLPDSLSYKNVLLNGEETQLVINSSTKPYYKEFQSLPGQYITMGDYVEWSNRVWLVSEADSDDEIYIDGKLYECNYQLRWQNNNGEIISKWAYIENASAYNNGEEYNKVITLATNQFMVWMPIDNDTVVLRNGKRMFVDNYMKEPSCYEVTRPDNVSMKFGDKGCTYYIFTQTERNEAKDKLVELEDGIKVWIADYKEPSTPTPPQPSDSDKSTDLTATISGNKELKVGFNRTYTVEFADEKTGNTVDWNDVEFEWNVDSALDVSQNAYDNKIELSVSDESLVGLSFILQCLVGDMVVGQIEITIVEGW